MGLETIPEITVLDLNASKPLWIMSNTILISFLQFLTACLQADMDGQPGSRLSSQQSESPASTPSASPADTPTPQPPKEGIRLTIPKAKLAQTGFNLSDFNLKRGRGRPRKEGGSSGSPLPKSKR